jgi:uncharacterized protein YozE (UPF0346 family)
VFSSLHILELHVESILSGRELWDEDPAEVLLREDDLLSKDKVSNLADYQWSEEAVPLKDSIYNLLDTLMEVDKKFKEFSSEMASD